LKGQKAADLQGSGSDLENGFTVKFKLSQTLQGSKKHPYLHLSTSIALNALSDKEDIGIQIATSGESYFKSKNRTMVNASVNINNAKDPELRPDKYFRGLFFSVMCNNRGTTGY